MSANALERLVEQLRRLPGIGSKSARRLAYHLVEMDQEDGDQLGNTVLFALTYQLKTLANFVLIPNGIKQPLWWWNPRGMSWPLSGLATIGACITS